MQRTKRTRAILSAAIGTLAFGGSAVAQSVTLTTNDNSVSISGEILEFDGAEYKLSTVIGTVVLDADKVRCAGAGCPVLVSKDSVFTLAGSRALADALIPSLINGYSASLQASAVSSSIGNGNTLFKLSSATNGSAEITVSSSTTSAGFDALLDGQAAFALATRPARTRETRTFEQAGRGKTNDTSGLLRT